MTSMTDPKGDVWTWTFDLRGNEISAKDPDKGTTTTSYDDNYQPVTETDNRGLAITTSYDVLGRETGLYDGTSITASTLRAS